MRIGLITDSTRRGIELADPLTNLSRLWLLQLDKFLEEVLDSDDVYDTVFGALSVVQKEVDKRNEDLLRRINLSTKKQY